MKIGVLCQGWPLPLPGLAKGWQAVVTKALVEAFSGEGAEAFPVVWDAQTGTRKHALPEMDHAVVVSELARQAVMTDPVYRAALRRYVKGRLCLYVDAPLVEFEEGVDLIFTGEDWTQETKDSGFAAAHPRVIPVGFGADPKVFYPRERRGSGRTLLVSYPDPRVFEQWPRVWEDAKAVCQGLDREQWMVVGVGFSALWTDTGLLAQGRLGEGVEEVGEGVLVASGIEGYVLPEELGEWFGIADHYLDLRSGALDLTRIEAAYAGAMVMVPEALWRPQIHSSLVQAWAWRDATHLRELIGPLREAWRTPSQLSEIVQRMNSWPQAAKRILAALES